MIILKKLLIQVGLSNDEGFNAYKRMLIFTLFVFQISCQHGRHSHILKQGIVSGKRYEVSKLEGDSLADRLVTIYYPNSDSVYENYRMKNGIKEGWEDFFDMSAKDTYGILWKHNRKIVSEHYNASNKADMIFCYENIHDTDYANEFYYFTPERDTDKKKCFYSTVYCKNDTIKDGDDCIIRVELTTPRYKKGYVRICGFNEKFYLVPNGRCDSFELKYSPSGIYEGYTLINHYHLGKNLLRGEVVNYKNYVDSTTNKEMRKEMKTYFNAKFFVEGVKKQQR